jgi:hypothetical protein
MSSRRTNGIQEEDCMRAAIYARMSTDKQSTDSRHRVGG